MWRNRLKKFKDNPWLLFFFVRTHLYYRFIADKVSKKYSQVKFLDGNETIAYAIKHNMSLVRVGDGTFGYLAGSGIYFNNWQFIYNRPFAHRLYKALTEGQEQNILHCYPYRFALKTKREFIEENIGNEWPIWILAKVMMSQLINPTRTYGDSFCFHPRYTKNIDFKLLKQYFSQKHIIIITSNIDRFQNTRLGKTTHFVEAPNSDTWRCHQELEEKAVAIVEKTNISKSDILFIISTAEAAKVMVYDLAKQGYTAWDTGQFFDLATKEVAMLAD